MHGLALPFASQVGFLPFFLYSFLDLSLLCLFALSSLSCTILSRLAFSHVASPYPVFALFASHLSLPHDMLSNGFYFRLIVLAARAAVPQPVLPHRTS